MCERKSEIFSSFFLEKVPPLLSNGWHVLGTHLSKKTSLSFWINWKILHHIAEETYFASWAVGGETLA